MVAFVNVKILMISERRLYCNAIVIVHHWSNLVFLLVLMLLV